MKTVCLFCTRKGAYNINNVGKNSHIIKEDLFEVFGYKIEDYLRPKDSICRLCMNLMENLSKLKRRLLPLIFRSEPDCRKLGNLGKQWRTFASMSFDDEDSAEEHERYRTPTPSNLIKCMKVEPYNSVHEQRIGERERYRSLSRTNKSEGESELDSVVLHRTRKKRRGHGWSRRKNGQNSRPSSTYTCATSRCVSRSSDFDLSFNKSANVTPAFEIYICNDCKKVCRNLDDLTYHRIDQHKQLALFWCYMCNTRYITKNDLAKHNKTHTVEYNCVICKQIFGTERELLLHWQGHVNKSMGCKQCRRRFMDKRALRKHEKTVHLRNMSRRIDYSANSTEMTQFQDDGNYQVKILLQDECS